MRKYSTCISNMNLKKTYLTWSPFVSTFKSIFGLNVNLRPATNLQFKTNSSELTLICSTFGLWNLRSKQWLAKLLILGWLRSLHMHTTGILEPLRSWMSSATPPLSSFPAIPSTSSISKICRNSRADKGSQAIRWKVEEDTLGRSTKAQEVRSTGFG